MAKSKKKAKKRSVSGDNFILMHGEKFIFALILCFALWMISRGSGLEQFTITPEQIKDAAAKADDRIKKNKVELEDVDDSLVVYDYSDYSRLIKSTLKPGMYMTPIRWEQSLFPEKIKRSDVVVLPLEKLQARACIGAIEYLGEDNQSGQSGTTGASGSMGRMGRSAGASETKGRGWIAVTGLVPVGKEFREYDEKFANAQYTDIARDIPKYIFYNIERGTRGEDGQISWNKIELEKVYEEEVDRWSSFGIDPVAAIHAVPTFSPTLPPLTMPCPPLVNKSYGEEVTHLPEIPLLSDEQLKDQSLWLQEQKDLEQELSQLKKRDFDFSRAQAAADSTVGGPGQQTRGMRGMEGVGGVGMGRANQPGGMTPQRNLTAISKNMEEDYYLFRHFDFDVEPGKTYYYRVKLYLSNPNYGLDVNLVENAATVSQAAIESEYSEPSNPVALGTDSRILAESVEPAARFWQDPRVTVTSIYFSQEDAQESLARDKRLVRGQVANFMREQHKPVNMGGAGVTAPRENTGTGGISMRQDRKNTRSTDNHISNICLLDSLGGYSAKIGGSDMKGTAKVLLLEPNGLVKIQKLDTDKRELDRYNATGENPRR